MNTYNLTVILKDDLSEKDRKELLEAITKKFTKTIKEDAWGSRSLAYPIGKADKGYYIHYEFEAEPSTVPVLDKMIKLNEDVIRYLLIRKD